MRNLSANALTKIAEQYGNEPIVILDISWVDGTVMQYADRTVSSIDGKILSISDLDSVIQISKSDDSQEITVILDDTDGIIKNIMDTHDTHKRDVWMYQYFEELAITDRFLLFRGKINTPILWNEGDRTVTITIVSQLEDKEVGFSPEEGQFPHIPRDLIGKTWPSIFGTPLDVPAVQIGKAVTGTTLCGIGIVTGANAHENEDIGSDSPDIAEASARHSYLVTLSEIYRSAAQHTSGYKPQGNGYVYEENTEYIKLADDYLKQANEISVQIAETIAQYNKQKACAEARRKQTVSEAGAQGLGCNPVRILGGEDFPRGTITLNINGGLFTGYFSGSSDFFVIENRNHPEHTAAIAQTISNREKTPRACEPDPPISEREIWETQVPPGYGNASSNEDQPFDPVALGGTGGGFYAPGHRLLEDIYKEEHLFTPKQITKKDKMNSIMRHFWADAGASVVLEGYEPITYIVSIVPGTVLQVKAFKTFNGIQRLINVPSSMWSTEVKQYGSIAAVQVTVSKALSTLEDQNWSDDLYVTFESDVGPNIVDIITYLIQTYTDLQIDTVSFNAVETKLNPFPANFALLDRKNIIEVLSEIAFQARCNLRLINGKFYLTYLAEEPSTVDTITLDDIENQSVEVFLTLTEDIVTKYTVLWRLSYAQNDLNKIILRHNVKKYGIQEEEYDYYLYNQPDIIHKIATFWLIRKANTWKRIRFNTFLNKLNLETFDAVLLQFGSKKYVANTDVKAIIEQANIDGENYNIIMECWLPVKSGEMSAYEFAWPANVSEQWIFPTDREVDLGLDGGNGIGRNATGTLPVGDVSNINDQTIYVGGVNVIFGPQTDRGDPHPSDQGFTAQSLLIDTTLADVVVEEKPNLNLLLNYTTDIESPKILEDFPGITELVLEQTRVRSTGLFGKVGYLGDIIGIDPDGTLVMKTTSYFRGPDQDGACKTGMFHFKFDAAGTVWGAGTAFLREDAVTPPPEIPTSEEERKELVIQCDPKDTE